MGQQQEGASRKAGQKRSRNSQQLEEHQPIVTQAAAVDASNQKQHKRLKAGAEDRLRDPLSDYQVRLRACDWIIERVFISHANCWS